MLATGIKTYVIKASHSKKFSSLSGPNKMKKKNDDESSECTEDRITQNHLKTKNIIVNILLNKEARGSNILLID